MLLKELNLKPRKTTLKAQKKFGELIKSPAHGEDQYKSIYDLENERNPDIERLGAGFFATAYANAQEPGTAIKVAKPFSVLKNDPYFKYVSTLAKHKEGADNRYFPKIYDVKVFKDPEGLYTYSVDMERLQPFSSLSTDEMLQIGNHIFYGFDQMIADANEKKKLMKKHDVNAKRQHTDPRPHDKKYSIKDTESYQWAISRAMMRGIATCLGPNADPATNIKDSELKRALVILRSIIKASATETETGKQRAHDIHQGNIMVRRGPFMPQLVITDPLV